jgi:hypothetical protein
MRIAFICILFSGILITLTALLSLLVLISDCKRRK